MNTCDTRTVCIFYIVNYYLKSRWHVNIAIMIYLTNFELVWNYWIIPKSDIKRALSFQLCLLLWALEVQFYSFLIVGKFLSKITPKIRQLLHNCRCYWNKGDKRNMLLDLVRLSDIADMENMLFGYRWIVNSNFQFAPTVEFAALFASTYKFSYRLRYCWFLTVRWNIRWST